MCSVNHFTDPRDNHVYPYVRIDNLDWFAKNLNYETLDGTGSWCYDDDPSNCDIYGRLYNWAAAMAIDETYNNTLWDGSDLNHQGICPVGWRVPSDADWTALTNFVGTSAGIKLRAQTGWFTEGPWGVYVPGTDEFGFSALPGGDRQSDEGDGRFYGAGLGGLWWSATAVRTTANHYARFLSMRHDRSYVGISYLSNKNNAYSLRCVRN